jgi:hypothetical protein
MTQNDRSDRRRYRRVIWALARTLGERVNPRCSRFVTRKGADSDTAS